MKQVLSIEQMKHLKELGLDISDASMVFQRGSATRHEWVLHVMGYADVSLREKEFAYTLQDILGKLPCFIGNEVLTIQKLADSYTCLYMNPYTRSFINITEGEELIDAVYDMLCWCIENGYVKVGKEEK
jgi:hypothetical protein